jgi:dephospho-CoA kinase
MSARDNIILGLTGGMGCGKSTALAFFRDAGFKTYDCDEIVRTRLSREPAYIAAVAARLGREVLAADGQIDRERLAARAFANPADLTWIEGQLHPRLYEDWRATFGQDRQNDWAVEVPLLFEKDLQKWFDYTVCVTADSAVQLERLARRGMAPAQARERLARQMPAGRKCELADRVLVNDGSPDFLRAQILRLIADLRASRSHQ